MKKVVELENRWKAYKYKTIIFYTFIVVLVAFVALLVFFIKFQIDNSNAHKYSTKPATIIESPKKVESTPPITTDTKAHSKINFICRQVTTDKLTVRKDASFQSKALGYYPLDAIFCISESKNGLVKTQNGWVSESDKFSQIVDVNMFVDTGFYKYKNIATTKPNQSMQPKNTAKTDIEEVKVFDTPINAISNAEATTKPKSKAKPIITSQNFTKEQSIEFKKADFRRSNSYDIAIEVARFYFEAKDYTNSIKWALNASNADSKGKQKSESFIIYAKSLYLSGKQEQAIAVLDRYITSTSSQDAIDTLNKMKQGII